MKKVLVVDDSKFMRIMIKAILTRNGYNVVGEADNGKDGVRRYKELSPDLVTMDITMKELDGIGALKEIIKYDPSAKIIMVSAMGQEPLIRESVTAGAKGFLVKPFDEKVVVSTIGKLLKS